MWKCRPSAWILPGLISVGLLLLIAMILKAGTIENDLTKRAISKLSADHPWASVELDGRDLAISGVAPSAAAKQEALALADGVFRDRDAGTWGVRVVDGSAVDQLAIQSPFVTSGKFDGSTMTLSGYVGSEAATGVVEKAVVDAMPGVNVINELQAAGGSPDGLDGQVGFAVGQVKEFASGEFKLSDSSLDISGVAKDNASFDAANAALAGSLPAGLSLGTVDIAAPVASPYVFGASKTVSGVTLSGSVPNNDIRQALVSKAGDVANGAPVIDKMVLSSGASDDYQDRANYALDKLALVDSGNATVSDKTLSFNGNFADRDSENAFRAKLGTGLVAGLAVGKLALSSPEPAPAPEPEVVAAVEPEPKPEPVPVFSPYIFGAQKTADGIVLEGNVPSEAVRDDLVKQAAGLTSGSVTNNLAVTDDAPANFNDMTSFGLSQFGSLNTAELSTFGDTMSLSGSAKSPAAQSEVVDALSAAPDGVVVGSTNIGVTPVSPFTYGATVSSNASQVILTGNVPSATSKGALVSSARGAGYDSVINQTAISAGAPDSFINAASFANKMVSNFAEGSVQISDQNIRINGVAKDSATYAAAHASADRVPAGYSVVEKNISLPVASPYVYSAVKNGDDVTFSGSVPSDAVKVGLSGAGGSNGWTVTDETSLANGAPAGFVDAANYAASQVARFTEGSVEISDQNIRINGTAKDSASYAEGLQDAGTPPAGFKVVQTNIGLPVASPYRYSAVKNGGDVSFNGSVPSDAVKIGLSGAGGSKGWNVTEATTLANGAPIGFVNATNYSNDMISQFTNGSVRIQDTDITIDGTATSLDAYNTAIEAANNPPEGFTVVSSEIDLPVISPYAWSATRDGNNVTLGGFVPSDAVRAAAISAVLSAIPDATVTDNMQLADGVPANVDWSGATGFGANVLGNLSKGSVSYSDAALTVRGTAASGDSYNTATSLIADSKPAGITEDVIAIDRAAVSPFTLNAAKDGGVTIFGLSPGPEASIVINAAANRQYGSDLKSVNLALAGGAPTGYSSAAVRGLESLARLETGKFAISDTTTTLTGVVPFGAPLGEIKQGFEKGMP
ncbi:MAG: hypothetical protein ABJK39_05575, partial [Hyphomicrobiales bacterium]